MVCGCPQEPSFYSNSSFHKASEHFCLIIRSLELVYLLSVCIFAVFISYFSNLVKECCKSCSDQIYQSISISTLFATKFQHLLQREESGDLTSALKSKTHPHFSTEKCGKHMQVALALVL